MSSHLRLHLCKANHINRLPRGCLPSANGVPVNVAKRDQRRLGGRFHDLSRPALGSRADLNGAANICFEASEAHNESKRLPHSDRRVLLKISGEALQGEKGCGIDPEVIRSVCREIASCWNEGYQIAVVVGGGNFFRGADAFDGIDRATADYVGMLATTMNAICMQSVLESFSVETRLQTAIEIREVAEPYIRRRAVRHLEKGRVVIFGAGTGNPFFTTDMAAALRAKEIDAQAVLKATKVDGVFSQDPVLNPNAEFLEELTYDRVLTERLNFMDHAALSLCREHSIPVHVFSLLCPGNITKAIRGDQVGTIIRQEEKTAESETASKTGLKKLKNHLLFSSV